MSVTIEGSGGVYVDSTYQYNLTDNATKAYVDDKFFQPTVQNANYTAAANDFILADTSLGSFILTLPLSPVENDAIKILDYKSSFTTHSLTVARNGKTIMGLAEDMVADVKKLIYKNNDWRIA